MNTPNENHEPTSVDDLQDRLIDRGLAEIVGRETPPDLTSRILAANVSPTTAAISPAMPRTRRSRAFWASLAVAAMLLVGVTVLLYPAVRATRETARGSQQRALFQVSEEPGLVLSMPEAVQESVPANVVPALAPNEGVRNYSTAASTTDGLFDAQAQPGDRTTWHSYAGKPQTARGQDSNGNFQWGVNAEGARPGLEAQGPNRKENSPYENNLAFRPNSQVGLQGLISDSNSTIVSSADPNARDDVLREINKPRVSLGYEWDGEKPVAEGKGPDLSGDQYTRIVENPFVKAVGGDAVSTFSIDVDTASYANVRQFLMQMNQLPPPDAVRIEELVNYFDYHYAPPSAISSTVGEPPAEPGAADHADVKSDDGAPAPFAAHVEVAGCPWAPEHRLVRIGIKGRELDRAKRPQSNLVFLVDVSGSMDDPAKLPLVIYGLEQLTRELGENDRVAIVVYASSEGLALPSTRGDKQNEILAALGRLKAGGSTAGGAGIQLAYQIAEDNFIKGGTNRVILCTDGDFNVGVTSTAELERMVEKKAKDTGVFLSVLGFGRGNLNDAMMESIAGHGNGNHSYIDNRSEARRVLVKEMSGTLVTIAKDVKIQVEFNPRKVAGYRLLGYENRMLRTEDFNDDKKDAGEIGAGHTVTALYEVVPAGKNVSVGAVDDLKYQPNRSDEDSQRQEVLLTDGGPDVAGELLTLKMRYKDPEGDTSRKLEWPISDGGQAFSAATGDFQFASAVAGFGMLLRDSQFKGNLTYAAVLELAQSSVGRDEHGYRAEFLEMVRKAKSLRGE